MPTPDEAARIKNYRSMRTRIWEDLIDQTIAYNRYVFENDPVYSQGADVDLSRFRGQINLYLDELLTHLSMADAKDLLESSLSIGWGSRSERLIDGLTPYIKKSLPDQQWGKEVVSPIAAADPMIWEEWLKLRLDELGATPENDPFGTPMAGPFLPKPRPKPAPPSSTPWAWILGAAAVVAGGAVVVKALSK